MMLRGFYLILGMSFTGSTLLLLFLWLSPLLRRYFSAAWHRRALCVLLAFFAVPAGALVRTATAAVYTDRAIAANSFAGGSTIPLPHLAFSQAAAKPIALSAASSINIPMLFMAVWLCVLVILLARKTVCLAQFHHELRHSLSPVEDEAILLIHRQVLREAGIQTAVRLCRSAYTITPMLTGLINPTVILPDIAWSQEELAFVLRHEITHCRHRDLWLKWAGAALCMLHWFNPGIWFLMRQLERWMELACDAAVAHDMDSGERHRYGIAILAILDKAQPRLKQGVFAAFCENKQTMKERLTAMINAKKTTKKAALMSAFTLALLLICGLLIGATVHNPTKAASSDQNNMLQSNSVVLASSEPLLQDEKNSSAAENTPMAFLRPVNGEAVGWRFNEYPGHPGIDFPRPRDTEIYASAAGVVTVAKSATTGYGNRIIIDHGSGYQTLYAHCNALLVGVDEQVEAGQVIAKVGRSGRAPEDQLHFEILYNGQWVDPEQYMAPVK